MREIKFRAWDISKKRMLQASKIDITLWGEIQAVDFSNDEPLFHLEFEIMQYTGLKDKNGKEIYEGDCLGGIWGGGHIGYCDKCKSFEFIMNEFGCAACSGDTHWAELVEDNGKMEVIGNVWENPELLEANQ